MYPATTEPSQRCDHLAERLDRSLRVLEHCRLCELRCGANRLAGEPAPCHLGDQTFCFKSYLSLTDEPELVPSLRIHLGGCNFRCRFCNTAPRCFAPRLGERLEPASVAREWSRILVEQQLRSIHLLGGEPTLHAHTILQIALHAGKPLPIVLDTNLYVTPEALELIEDVVHTYVADYKFGNDACAERLAGVPRYTEVLQRNLRTLAPTGRLIVRHLLMPGHIECCFAPVAEWVARELPGVRFNLMTGYLPAYRAAGEPTLGRLLRPHEITAARGRLRELGLT